MNLTLEEALQIPPLNRCTVVAGNNGLDRKINSVNSFDAPDVIPWLKQGELVLTSGYVFKNDEAAQVELIHEMAKKGCAGLCIQIKYFLPKLPEAMLKTANNLKLPLIEIPNDLSLSDLLASLMREVFTYENEHKGQEKKKIFLSQLLKGELNGKDAILANGREFGLKPGCGYICLFVSLLDPAHDLKKETADFLLETARSFNKDFGIDYLTMELDHFVIVILQSGEHLENEHLHKLALQFAKKFDELNNGDQANQIKIGIGTGCSDVLEISRSYQQACEAVNIGSRVYPKSMNHHIYDYVDLESYFILQQAPANLLSQYISRTIEKLIQYDKDNQTDLIKTLDVYLSCCGRQSEAARLLGVHRNTINFRMTKIKELLGKDLDDGETVFRVQLALKISRLLNLAK
ncbi:PucR family transcriptional regulator [Scopulibacillus cellulosilyticus]|uniref:PucR family transcriptional regulator n=1 Tax=Scopulibacillus cellulosilyticus TaxID=2665665 RepID=A0ABW2Q1P0_9BACL